MAVADQAFTALVVGGTATVTFRSPSNRSVYTVQQVSVEYDNAPIGCACVVRKNNSFITPMVPTGDAASGDPPIVLRGNDQMTVTFTGATNGDIVNVFIIFDDGTKE
jgi:hypothetical protein